MNKTSLSIVIPVYNEDKNILKTFKEIKKHIKVSHEIIVVYDFDNDTTLKVIAKSNKESNNVRLLKNFVYPGPSGAIRSGLQKAKSPFILVTMADLCDDLSQVAQMLDIALKNADIICPTRYSKGGRQLLKSSLKVWAPKSAGILLKLLTGIPTYDPTNSYKLYSKRVLNKLKLRSTISFSVTLEIIVKAHANGFKIVEIPTVWKDRQYGKTNFKLGRSIAAYFPWFLYAFINKPKK